MIEESIGYAALVNQVPTQRMDFKLDHYQVSRPVAKEACWITWSVRDRIQAINLCPQSSVFRRHNRHQVTVGSGRSVATRLAPAKGINSRLKLQQPGITEKPSPSGLSPFVDWQSYFHDQPTVFSVRSFDGSLVEAHGAGGD